MIGRVVWFNKVSGDGMVAEVGEGTLIYLHYTAIKGVERGNWQYPISKEGLPNAGDLIDYEVYENEQMKLIDVCSIIKQGN